VGASGRGKEHHSLAHSGCTILLRVVAIDGNDLRRLTQQSLREQIGLVTQDTFCFTTLSTIISFLPAGRDTRGGYAAAQMAYAMSLILSNHTSTTPLWAIRECCFRGSATAESPSRARFLKNAPSFFSTKPPPLSIPQSEKQIQLALQTLAAGRTVVAIAHPAFHHFVFRSIVVMDRGHIKEIGTHASCWPRSLLSPSLRSQFNRGAEHKDPSRKNCSTGLTL